MEILLIVELKDVMEQCIDSKSCEVRRSPPKLNYFDLDGDLIKDNMQKVVFSKRAFAALCTELHMFEGEETGGVFIGYYKDETYYIIENIFSGPNAKHKSAEYIYDFDYVTYQANMLAEIYEEEMDVLGIWHSHITSAPFSIADEHTNLKFAQLNKYGAITCLVDVQNEHFLLYKVSPEGEYTSLTYELLDETVIHYKESFLFKEIKGNVKRQD